MRVTAVFSGTKGPGGSVDEETGRLYMPFDLTRFTSKDQDGFDKAVANAVQHICDGLAGDPKLEEVLVGMFMPRSLYKDPWEQQKREDRADRVQLYVYTLPERGD